MNTNIVARRLGIRYPIVQGPFGGGLSTARLVGAVSNAGGLGSYGAHQLSPADIRTVVADIRNRTDRPFALNLWIPHPADSQAITRAQFDHGLKLFGPIFEKLGIPAPAFPEEESWGYAEQVDAVIEARPAVFSFVFGIPSPEVLSACHVRGITTIGAATTVEEAVAIEAAGVDMVLATGFEAGGHRPSFLRRAEESLIGTLALVPRIVDRVKIPIIAAGGIADRRGVDAAFALGAKAVQLGTAFLACEESGASPLHREIIRGPTGGQTTLSRGFTGRLARFIRNRFIEAHEKGEMSPLSYPLQSLFTGLMKRAAVQQENTNYMSLYAGQGAPLVQYTKAADLIASLVGHSPLSRIEG